MNTEEIDLARRIIACGLPVPKHFASADNVSVIATLSQSPHSNRYNPGDRGYCPKTRIMWAVVAMSTGPELLPALDDFALLGWLTSELEQHGTIWVAPRLADFPSLRWLVHGLHRGQSERLHSRGSFGSRIEALTTALEAMRAAPE